MRRNRVAVAFSFLLALSSHFARADAPGVYAITGATVHPVSGPDLAGATVVIRDGLIESVGTGVAVPADALVIDGKGMHVYPGLIDAQTSLGFPAPRPVVRRRGGGARPPQQQETLPETSPAFIAAQRANIIDDDADARRATGVTTIVTAPSFGIFNGQSAVLNLAPGPIESRVIRSPAGLQVSFSPRPAWTFPDSLMGVIADIRQTLLDAQQNAAAHLIYDKSPAGVRRPESDPSLDALTPVLRRDVPVVFVADSDLMMRRAAAIAREFNLRMIIAGARQGYRMADELKAAGTPVLVSVKWPTAPTSQEDREEQPLRIIRDRQLAPTTPSVLAKAGVSFALVSGSAKTSEFLPGIRKAIANGLSADEALRAVTLSPARILGVDRQLGTLERGKIANVVITDKPIFEDKAKVRRVFVDGREIRLPAEEKRGAGAATAATAVDGTWNLTVRSSQGDIAFRVTLRSEDGKVTGSFAGDRGSGEVRNGSLDGTTVEFTIPVRGQQETESADWVFHGTIDGSSMQGSVNTNLGTFQFSGSRSR